MKSKHILAALGLALLASCTTAETDHDLFTKADINKDGQLSLDEVNKMGLPRLFNRFDMDGDGSVTLQEARTVEPGFEEKVFAERDLNRDGKVTYQEYEKGALSKGGLKIRFSNVDANHDGIITKAEAEAHVAKLESESAKPY